MKDGYPTWGETRALKQAANALTACIGRNMKQAMPDPLITAYATAALGNINSIIETAEKRRQHSA